MDKQKWDRLLNAARHGNPDAQWEVGHYYFEGYQSRNETLAIAPRPSRAVMWYRRAAENGNVHGQNALALCLASGIGVEKNDNEAVFWTKKAINAGDASAASNLARIYRDQSNYKKAFFWFKSAIEMGDYDALCELRQYYYFGLGCKRSSELAVQCFNKLIKFKWPTVTETARQNAMYWLGIAHLQGQGVSLSIKKAKELFKKADKDNDHMPSHEMLLLLGVDFDPKNYNLKLNATANKTRVSPVRNSKP